MKIFSFIRRQMTPLFALRYLFLARPNSKDPAMSRKIQFACLFVLLVLLGLLSTATQSGFAQNAAGAADPPLTYSNNFLVTGDYVVGGAYGMNVRFTTINGLPYTTGTINIPDADPVTKKANPGITGTIQVPAGAQIVAALLYWETVEKAGVMPGDPGSGQKGFFGPFVNNVAQTYPIAGVVLTNHSATSFSNGGCSGLSTGKTVRAYRADVRGLLQEDAKGNVLANGQYQVVLPSTGPNTPLTLGATLVIVYRVISPSVPLNAIAIYDGAFAPNATPNLTMMQQIQGFYDAAPGAAWRLTHVVGAGKSNKFQTAYLNNVPLPNLYTTGQPFPGWYGNWDNTTWTSGDPRVGLPNTVAADSDTATAQVIANTGNPGCVSWGAAIFSTTVNDPDKDGILRAWKLSKGYTDVATGQHVYLSGAADPGQGIRDVFIQLDYITDQNTGARFQADPNALTKVHDALAAHNVQLHITGGNAIPQQACMDDTSTSPPKLCPYPNQLVTTFRAGFGFLKNQPLNYPDESSCETAANGPCIRRFPPAQKDSYRYGIFADALGAPDWTLQDGTLVSVVAKNNNTVTFTTKTPHGLTANPNCASDGAGGIGNGRVTVVDAISNPSLNGTYCVTSVSTSPANQAPDTFTIQLTKAPNATYTHSTDPNLGVASGHAGKRSATSDLGGSGMLISLGSWGAAGQQVNTQAGTMMHELGHLFGLPHGGYYFDTLGSPYVPTYEPNCKPNYQSVMSYRFQVDLMDKLINNQIVGGFLDFSGEELVAKGGAELSETNGLTGVTALAPASNPNGAPFYWTTRWYALPTPSQVLSTDYAKRYCDGTPVPANGPHMFIHEGPATSISWLDPLNNLPPFKWQNGQDIDFDINGSPSGKLRGFNDWAKLDLRLGGATASAYVINGGFPLGGGGFPLGGGGFPLGGGGFPLGGGGFPLGGGGFPLGGGASAGDINFETANSVTRPPRNLTATEAASPRTITLNWTEPTFGQIIKYNVYRSDAGAAFHLIGSVSGNPPATTFPDSPACNPGGYQYEVTAVILNPDTNAEQESVPSNIASIGSDGALTGCYVVSNFSSPANAVQGSSVQVMWTLTDDFNTKDNPVTKQAANTLFAIGPLPNTCTTGRTKLLADGVPTSGVDAFTNVANQFTFTWNNTDAFCAGSYSFELDLDHVQGSPAQVQPDATQLQLGIDVTDTDSPHVTTVSISNGVVGTFYTNTISEDGGVNDGINPFKWTIVPGSVTLNGSPAPDGSIGISFPQQNAVNVLNGTLSGIPSAAGMFSFTVQVTDSVGNIGTQTLTMTVTTPVAQINQLLVPDSSAPGGAAFVLTLNGTGFGPGSKVLWNGSPRTTTFIGNRQLTAAISGSDVAALATASVSVSNPVTIFNKAVPNSNIDFFQITPTTSASLSRTDYPTGTKPNGLTAADFNGDGKLDLAIANSADNTVTILQGNGDGTFTAQPALATGAGSNPQLPTAGDFNGDGKLDLAVANFANNTVSVFLGNGDGTFQAPVTYPVGAGASSLVTGDFNRDGELDVAIGNQNDHTVSILLGNGDGTFQAHVDYPAGAPDVAGVALGDVNRDGKLDLVVANPSANTVSVLLGNGDGTFQAPVAYATGNHPVSLAVADLNGDGILDLAVTNLNARTVSILIGNGNGTFQAHMDFITTSGALIGPVAVATGDFNGDGKVDLAITNQTDNSVSILLGNGDGTFHAPLEFATGNVAAGVASGDFNGDGRLDVAVADFSANTVSVMLQRPEPASTLAVSNATASQVSLTWTASASTTVVGYNVYRGTTSGGPYTKVNLAIVAAPAFTDMSVASGTTYYYVVTAVDPGNLESINSNEVSATTPPQPPTSLAVTNVTASQVTLTWTASTTASVVSYNVYRSTISGVYKTPLASVNAGTSTYTDMTVAPGTTYYYVVTAVGPGNVQSVNSNEVSATTP